MTPNPPQKESVMTFDDILIHMRYKIHWFAISMAAALSMGVFVDYWWSFLMLPLVSWIIMPFVEWNNP